MTTKMDIDDLVIAAGALDSSEDPQDEPEHGVIVMNSDDEHEDSSMDDNALGHEGSNGKDPFEPFSKPAVPRMAPAPGRKIPKDFIAATAFAGPYKSVFTRTPPGDRILSELAHVNCGYLSKPGRPPTLTELKQHAQSLTVLIKNLTLSTRPGVIDGALHGREIEPMNDGETYDFLNDLGTPYTGPESPSMRRHHEMPLTSVLNMLEDVSPNNEGRRAFRSFCPLHMAPEIAPNAPSLPYATHQNLIQHANEVLELLDHEYSAKGGLLSILPPEDQKEDRKMAETTLLGQLVLYLTRLVQRQHNLERSYANALDVIAGEAVVPAQTLSRLGPEGRKGREMVYPQDRYVLVNCGEDVQAYMDREFEKKERIDEKVEENYLKMGVTGEAIWEQRGGKEMARGITAIDVQTRYFRLRKDPLKTIFVIPAHLEHPGTKSTRTMEGQPTVVSVVKPVWPERASVLEMKHRADMADLKRLRVENSSLLEQAESRKREVEILWNENMLKDASERLLKKNEARLKELLENNAEKERQELLEAYNAANKHMQDAKNLMEDAKKEKVAAAKARASTDEATREFYQMELDAAKARADTKKQAEEKIAEKLKHARETDELAARSAEELVQKLKAHWLKQISETEVLKQCLGRKMQEIGKEPVDEDIVQDATEKAQQDFENLLGTTATTSESS